MDPADTGAPAPAARAAAILLVGGQSLRMGRAKADLLLRRETLEARALRALGPVARAIVVVGSSARPACPPAPGVMAVADRLDGVGPLAAFATGLAALPAGAEAVLLLGVDLPFFEPAHARVLLARLGARDAAIPRAGGRLQPLAAAYRPRVRAAVDALLENGCRALRDLIAQIDVEEVEPAAFRDFDPELLGFADVDTPEAYAAARARLRPEEP